MIAGSEVDGILDRGLQLASSSVTLEGSEDLFVSPEELGSRPTKSSGVFSSTAGKAVS